MHQPKRFRAEYDLNEVDIVLFLKQDSLLSKTYQYGIVVSVQQSSEGVIRKVKVKYQNIFKSSNNSFFYIFFYNFFFINFFIYIKMSQNLSAKYYRENKERLQKRAHERY